MNSAAIRVVIADDEVHIRTLVGTLVRSLGYEIVGEADNGSDAATLVKVSRPDLVLLDINMPRQTGVEALPEILEDCPDACVIILTSVTDLETVTACVELGAAGYIRKDTPLAEMKKLIQDTWESFVEE